MSSLTQARTSWARWPLSVRAICMSITSSAVRIATSSLAMGQQSPAAPELVDDVDQIVGIERLCGIGVEAGLERAFSNFTRHVGRDGNRVHGAMASLAESPHALDQ